MKTILAIIIAALSLGTAQAVEYVTLTDASPSKALAPTDLIEVVGCSNIRTRLSLNLLLKFSDGTETTSDIGGYVERANAFPMNTTLGQAYTGLTEVSLRPGNLRGHVITLKITSASEINAVTPSAVLVLPENSTGNYDVVIEASDDLVSWLPFFSQTVNSQTAKKFFRTRVVRSQGPAPAKP
jgi:hypothetical protein